MTHQAWYLPINQPHLLMRSNLQSRGRGCSRRRKASTGVSFCSSFVSRRAIDRPRYDRGVNSANRLKCPCSMGFARRQLASRCSCMGESISENCCVRGALRHKLGNCKPHGGGSVHIKVERMELRGDPKDRYRSVEATASLFEGDDVVTEITRRTQPIRERTDPTMQHLRAMLIYTSGDPRAGNLNYPTYEWLNTHSSTPLKPTL